MNDDDYETVLPLPVWAILLIIFFCWPSIVLSEPIAKVSNDKITVTLFNDKCELADQITNLPMKAEWVEGGKTYAGCWGPRPDLGVVAAYFEDKTVALIPFEHLVKVVGA